MRTLSRPTAPVKHTKAQPRPQQARVVVTDPTIELAIVLGYDPTTMAVPIVVTTGVMGMDEEIQEFIECGTAVVESKWLTNMLFDHCEIGQSIPEELYFDVAAILSSVYQLNGIVDRITTMLAGEWEPVQRTYGQTHERHTGGTSLARPGVRVSLD